MRIFTPTQGVGAAGDVQKTTHTKRAHAQSREWEMAFPSSGRGIGLQHQVQRKARKMRTAKSVGFDSEGPWPLADLGLIQGIKSRL